MAAAQNQKQVPDGVLPASRIGKRAV